MRIHYTLANEFANSSIVYEKTKKNSKFIESLANLIIGISLATLMADNIDVIDSAEILKVIDKKEIYDICHGCGQLYGSAAGFPVILVGPELQVRAQGSTRP